jgi:hypothetical protein
MTDDRTQTIPVQLEDGATIFVEVTKKCRYAITFVGNGVIMLKIFRRYLDQYFGQFQNSYQRSCIEVIFCSLFKYPLAFELTAIKSKYYPVRVIGSLKKCPNYC